MFEKFFEFAGITNQEEIQSLEQFMENYEGFTFLGGMYRVFKKDDVPKWNGIVGKMIGFDTMAGYILAQLEKGNIKQTAVQDRYILNTVTD